MKLNTKGGEANAEDNSSFENQTDHAFKQAFDDENVQPVFAHDSVKIKLKNGNLAGIVAVFICQTGGKIYRRIDLSTNDHVILFPGNNCILWDFEKEPSSMSCFKFRQKVVSWKTEENGDRDPHGCLMKDAQCKTCKKYAEKNGSYFVKKESSGSGNAQQNATGPANVPSTTVAQGASRNHPSFMTPGILKSETKCPNCDVKEMPSTKDPIFLSNPSNVTASNANPSAVPGPANATGAPATTIGPQGPIGPGGPSGGEGDSANTKSPESKSDKATEERENNLDGKHEEQDITDPATDPGTSEVSPNAKDLDDVAEDANILPSEETEMEIE